MMMQHDYGYGDSGGFGDGGGFGYGFGYGHGDGGGFGYGGGFGDGGGGGYGFGYGFGYGGGDKTWGRVLARVSGLQVRHLAPWPYVAVGCEVHSISCWREHWKEIAEAEDVDITTDAVQDILARLNNNKEK